MRNLFRLLFLMFIRLEAAFGFVDMFIDANETSSLIGLSSSLFYVFNGELRQNSIKYESKIPFNKNVLTINWKTSNLVNYRFKLVDLDEKSRVHNLSVSSEGFVPKKRSEFKLFLNCSALNASNKPYSIHIGLNVYFELNNSLSTGFQQLISMPPLNFTIKYNKICMKKSEYLQIKKRLNSNNYLIAYLIFGALGGFALFIGIIASFMFIHSKIKAKKLHTKYEALNSKLSQQQQLLKSQQQQLICEQLKNKVYTKNGGSMRKANPYARRSKQVDNEHGIAEVSNKKQEHVNELNIYETVPDGPLVNQSQENNNTHSNPVDSERKLESSQYVHKARPRPESRKKEKIMLNLTTNTMHSMYNSSMSTSMMQNHLAVSNKRANIDMCTKFSSSQVELESPILEGTFSKLFVGKLSVEKVDQDGLTSTETSRVFIKVLNDCASNEQISIMLKESCAFRGLKHKNLNSILGVCYREDGQKPLTLFNYCELGNLKHYLSALRTAKCKNSEFLQQLANQTSFSEHPLISTQELLFIMLQMFKALNYLHGKHVLHKDISTRNCWLDSNLSLKLADTALSRDLFPDDFQCLADNENKPVFWLAIETLKDNVLDIQTEIWACGVFLWECFSLAAQPYEGMDPFEMQDYLTANESNRLQKPVNCPNELFDMFKNCWHSMPEERPTLKEVFYSLHKFYSNLDNYV